MSDEHIKVLQRMNLGLRYPEEAAALDAAIAALGGVEAVAWEYRRSREPSGWTDWEKCNEFTHAEIQGGHWDNQENGRKWESRALFALPAPPSKEG